MCDLHLVDLSVLLVFFMDLLLFPLLSVKRSSSRVPPYIILDQSHVDSHFGVLPLHFLAPILLFLPNFRNSPQK